MPHVGDACESNAIPRCFFITYHRSFELDIHYVGGYRFLGRTNDDFKHIPQLNPRSIATTKRLQISLMNYQTLRQLWSCRNLIIRLIREILSQVDEITHLCLDLNWSMRPPSDSRFLRDLPDIEARHTTRMDEVDMVLLAQPFRMLRNAQKMEIRLGGIDKEQGWSLYPDLHRYKSYLEPLVMSSEPATNFDTRQVYEMSHRMLKEMPPPCWYDSHVPVRWFPDTWENPGRDCGRHGGKAWAFRTVIVRCGLPWCQDGHELRTWRFTKQDDKSVWVVPDGPSGIYSE